MFGFYLVPFHLVITMASGINIYSELLISRIRILDHQQFGINVNFACHILLHCSTFMARMQLFSACGAISLSIELAPYLEDEDDARSK